MLAVPEADDVIGRYRHDHDPYARFGVPAHVTVRRPFLPPAEWDRIQAPEVLASLLPVEITLARIDDRPGALVIAVEPDGLPSGIDRRRYRGVARTASHTRRTGPISHTISPSSEQGIQRCGPVRFATSRVISRSPSPGRNYGQELQPSMDTATASSSAREGTFLNTGPAESRILPSVSCRGYRIALYDKHDEVIDGAQYMHVSDETPTRGLPIDLPQGTRFVHEIVATWSEDSSSQLLGSDRHYGGTLICRPDPADSDS
jgi:hypothetical protein